MQNLIIIRQQTFCPGINSRIDSLALTWKMQSIRLDTLLKSIYGQDLETLVMSFRSLSFPSPAQPICLFLRGPLPYSASVRPLYCYYTEQGGHKVCVPRAVGQESGTPGSHLGSSQPWPAYPPSVDLRFPMFKM